VVAKRPTVCLVQKREDFLSMLDTYPYLKDFFYRCALERMREGYHSLLGNKVLNLNNQQHCNRIPKCVRQAISYVDSHYKESVSLDDIAEKIGMSRFHLSRLFNRHAGKSFRTYLNQIRIKAAKEMMLSEDVNVSEAGFAVGYNDLSYFSRVFRSIEGISPSAFRKTL
jgi:YesN/AraC family two-component response regulator